jgi:hypothetical protein
MIMKFRYASQWAYFELLVACLMTLAVAVKLKPEWWGWLLFAPLFGFMIFEGIRKIKYSLTVDGDLITVGSFNSAQYVASKIKDVNVWMAKGGRVAVVDLDDGQRFNFPSNVEGFDKLVDLLKSKAKRR